MLRPRFSLRALFVLVTIIGVGAGWVVHQLHWIRQRHKVLEELYQSGIIFDQVVAAPWSIRLFSERGVPMIVVDPDVARDSQMVTRLKRLFPESRVCTPIDGRPVNRNPNPGFGLKEI